MTRPLASLAPLLLALAVVGCPPGSARAPRGPPPLATGNSSSTEPDVPPAPETATPTPAPPPVAPPSDEGPVRKGARLRVTDDRAVDLVDVLAAGGDQPARARFDVQAGACFLPALLAAGGTFEVGGVTLEVAAIDPAAATVRFLHRPGGGAPTTPVRVVDAPAVGPVTLDGLAIHAFSDGVWIGVGNVRSEGGGSLVSLVVFPPGYAEQPAKGHDTLDDAAVGSEQAGKVRVVRVTGLQHGSLAGKVELLLSTP